jgi:hypothetical protein
MRVPGIGLFAGIAAIAADHAFRRVRICRSLVTVSFSIWGENRRQKKQS